MFIEDDDTRQQYSNLMYLQFKPKRQMFSQRRCNSLKWAKKDKHWTKTSTIYTSTKTSKELHPFPGFKFTKFYFSSRLDEAMASFMDCTLCLILIPTLFCRCLKNSFSSFSRFSLGTKDVVAAVGAATKLLVFPPG